MTRRTYALAEAFREAPKLLGAIVLVTAFLACLPLSANAASFSVDSQFGNNCTQQLQCGTAGLLCLEGVCQYVFDFHPLLVRQRATASRARLFGRIFALMLWSSAFFSHWLLVRLLPFLCRPRTLRFLWADQDSRILLPFSQVLSRFYSMSR